MMKFAVVLGLIIGVSSLGIAVKNVNKPGKGGGNISSRFDKKDFKDKTNATNSERLVKQHLEKKRKAEGNK